MSTGPDVLGDSSQAQPAPDGFSAPSALSAQSASSATLGGESKRSLEQITLLLFIVVPFIALLGAVPLVWGWG